MYTCIYSSVGEKYLQTKEVSKIIRTVECWNFKVVFQMDYLAFECKRFIEKMYFTNKMIDWRVLNGMVQNFTDDSLVYKGTIFLHMKLFLTNNVRNEVFI